MRALALAALSIAAAAPAAADARVRDAGPFPGYALGTDGTRHLAGVTRTGAYVVDVEARVRREVPGQAGCEPTGVGKTELLFTCNGNDPRVTRSGFAVDLATGARRPLPDLSPETESAEFVRYVHAGRRWVEVAVSGRNYAFSKYVDRTTGELRFAPAGRRTIPDLDAPALARALCSPLRRPRHEDPHEGFFPGPLAPAGPFAAAEEFRKDAEGELQSRLVLQRCGSPRQTIARCLPAYCADISVTSRGTVAWTEVDHQPRLTRLRVRFAGAHRTVTHTRRGRWRMLVVGRRVYAAGDDRLLRIVR